MICYYLMMNFRVVELRPRSVVQMEFVVSETSVWSNDTSVRTPPWIQARSLFLSIRTHTSGIKLDTGVSFQTM